MFGNYFQENLAALIRMNQAFMAGFIIECIGRGTHPKNVDQVIAKRISERVHSLGEALNSDLPKTLDASACEIVATLMDLTRDHIALADLMPHFPVELRDEIKGAGSAYLTELVSFVQDFENGNLDNE